MSENKLHELTLENQDAILNWFSDKTKNLPYPIYSSYDLRDSGYKVTNVDANIYPAGFNNICPTDQEVLPSLFKKYFEKHYPLIQKILLITEEHTQNPYYWDNVATIMRVIEEAGYEIKAAFPKALEQPMILESARGHRVEVHGAYHDSQIWKAFNPDLLISNNDFSESREDWARDIMKPMNPPREMGWYQRKKSRYFKHYNNLVQEFSKVSGIDPFLMGIETELFEDFDINSEGSRSVLSDRVNEFLQKLAGVYKDRGLDQKPYAFVKNNSGTYGLAVMKVDSASEIKEWTYKARKKMKAAKGGRNVQEVIIQEGVPSRFKEDQSTAEPVIYMVGCELGGGFLRTHAEKSSTDSLNSPGAVYKKLCMADLHIKPEMCPMENVYGWSARLGLLAIGLETEEMGVNYQDYIKAPCGGPLKANNSEI